jgi:2-oxoglutarate/2-oxoacid ferredoxin oxidoreductase subunit beta
MDLHDTEQPEPISDLHRTLMTDELSALEPPQPVTAEPGESIAAVIKKMIDRKHGAVCIVEGEEMVGIFTERDVLLRVAGKAIDIHNTPVSKVMTADLVTLKKTSTLAAALNQMAVAGMRHLPLLEDKKPVGITSVRGALYYIWRNALS